MWRRHSSFKIKQSNKNLYAFIIKATVIFSHASPIPTLSYIDNLILQGLLGEVSCLLSAVSPERGCWHMAPPRGRPRVTPRDRTRYLEQCAISALSFHLACTVRDAVLLLPALVGSSSSPAALRLLQEPLPSHAAAAQTWPCSLRVVCRLPGTLLLGTPCAEPSASHRVTPPCLPAAALRAVLALAPPADPYWLHSLGSSLQRGSSLTTCSSLSSSRALS